MFQPSLDAIWPSVFPNIYLLALSGKSGHLRVDRRKEAWEELPGQFAAAPKGGASLSTD